MSQTSSNQKCCVVCGKPFEKELNCFGLFRNKHQLLCGQCQKQLVPSSKKHVIYEYNDFFRALLFAYKGLGDLALAPVFLAGHEAKLKAKYHDYVIVYAPSYELDDKRRGFATLPWIFKSLQLPILSLFYKKTPYKQATSKHREDIALVIGLKEEPQIRGKKVLLVDDVTTSGHTIQACIDLLSNYHPKKIAVLVLASKEKKKKGKGKKR